MNKIKAITAGLIMAGSFSAFADSGRFEIDPGHTFPKLSYEHLGFSTQTSRIDGTRGIVAFDTERKTGSVDVEMDLRTLTSGSKQLDEHLQGSDFFDTKSFPTATFKSNKVLFEGSKPKSVEGVLTMKGVAKPATLIITSFKIGDHPMTKKRAIGVMASTVIKRSDFGIVKFIPAVSDEVKIDISLEAGEVK